MQDYSELLKLLKGQQEEVDPMMSIGEPAEVPMAEELPEAQEDMVQNVAPAVVDAEQNPAKNEIETKDVNDQAKAPTQKTKEEVLADQLRQIREEKKLEYQAAKKDDASRNMWANAVKALGQIGAADVQRGAGVQVGLKPFEAVKGRDTASPILAERDSTLKNMMAEYKLLNPESKARAANKIFQTRSGLVQLDEEGNPVEIYKDPYMASGAKVKEESLGLRRDKFAQDKDIKNRISDKEVETITQFDDGVRILDKIDDILKNTDVNEDIGPYASRLENASNFVPGMDPDPDFVRTQQLVGIQLADYIKSISGAAVSEQEAQRLLKNIPNMTDKPQAFKLKLDEIREELSSAKDDYLDNIGVQKSGAKKFKQEKDSGKGSSKYTSAQESGIEKVMEKNGIDRATAINALKKAGKL